MKNLYKLLSDQNEKRKKYFQYPYLYGKEIKKAARGIFADARVILFGSIITGKSRPDSDFDVMIVTDHNFSDTFEQAKIKVKILKHFSDNPFEIHLVTPRQFEDWYKGFIKKDYLEV